MFRKLREKVGLTQQQLADIVKVDRVAVTRWESGAAYPRASKLPIIAKTLNCSIDELFKEEPGADTDMQAE